MRFMTTIGRPDGPFHRQSNNDRMFRVVALDLDSSIYVDGRRKCSKSDIKFLRGLQERGILLALATDRCMSEIKDFVLKLNPAEPLLITTGGGSTGHLCQVLSQRKSRSKKRTITGQVLCQEETISSQILQTAVSAAARQGCMTLYYHDDLIYANPTHMSHFIYASSIQKILDKELVFVGDDFRDLIHRPGRLPRKLQILAVQSVEKLSQKLDKKSTAVVKGFDRRIGGNFVQIVNPNASKGKALVKSFRTLEVPFLSCIASGFEGDDVNILLAAGVRVVTEPFLDQATKGSCSTIALRTSVSQNKDAIHDLRKMDRDGILWS